MIQKIKDFFNPLTAREKERKIFKNKWVSKETVVFADRNGRLTQLIGSDVIIKAYDELKMAGFKI